MANNGKLFKLFIVKGTQAGSWLDTWYVKEQAEGLEPVVICICHSEEDAQRVLQALQSQQDKAQNG